MFEPVHGSAPDIAGQGRRPTRSRPCLSGAPCYSITLGNAEAAQPSNRGGRSRTRGPYPGGPAAHRRRRRPARGDRPDARLTAVRGRFSGTHPGQSGGLVMSHGGDHLDFEIRPNPAPVAAAGARRAQGRPGLRRIFTDPHGHDPVGRR
jgi:hypothetical protein